MANRVAPRVLITGGMGQLGRSLASALSSLCGRDSVLLTDICKCPTQEKIPPHYRYLDVLDVRSMNKLVVEENVSTIVHFSALLSAVAEQNVELALDVNCHGVENVLNVARRHKLKVFIPSTIGVFGATTPRHHTPDITVQRPRTIYGVSKVFTELLGEYYYERYAVDFRSLRLPGIISDVQPGGGTTDYAIQMFYDALLYGRHKCYLRPDTQMPMMYGDDCMAAIVDCLLAQSESLSMRTYNVTGFSFTPEELAECIRAYLPNFQIHYDVCGVRQRIADSWPKSLDDSAARRDWGWRPAYSLDSTVEKMIQLVSQRLGKAVPVKPRQVEEVLATNIDNAIDEAVSSSASEAAIRSEALTRNQPHSPLVAALM